MCLHGNSAPLSIRYINAQLSALWQNAWDCSPDVAETHINMGSDDYETHKHARALAQFQFAGKQRGRVMMDRQDLFFDASFDNPRLDFICNHEAILFLTIKEGHLNKDHQRTSGPNARFERSHNISVSNVEVAFRVEFCRREIKGQDSRIGNDSLVKFVILNLIDTRPVFLSSGGGSSLSDGGKEALEVYLHHYLQFLRDAGHHVLFDLPGFDSFKYSPMIDYALTADKDNITTFSLDGDVFGVKVSAINDFLRDLWLGFASQAGGVFGEIPADHLSFCMAEVLSRDLMVRPDFNFLLVFTPPEVQYLCKHEVIVYFTLETIEIFEDDDYECDGEMLENYEDWGSQEKWKIAFIVNVKQELGSDGSVDSLSLDWKSARLSNSLSLFSGSSEAKVWFNKISKFLADEYIELIIHYQHGEIYHARLPDIEDDSLVISESIEETSEWKSHTSESQREVTGWTEEVNMTSLKGFDQVVVLSEDAINVFFRSLWSGSRVMGTNNALKAWKTDDTFNGTFNGTYIGTFDGTFGQMKIQLMSNNRAIVFVNVEKAIIKFKDRNDCECAGWNLAFEVQLTMVDHKDLTSSETWLTSFKESPLYKTYPSSSSFKHIILDLEHAAFVQKLSHTDGLFANGPSAALIHLKAAVQHAHAYLRHLSAVGLHHIHSVPLFTASDTASLGLTSVTFEVMAKTSIIAENCRHKHEAPVILVLGMCGADPAPTYRIPWSDEFITRRRRGASYSMLRLSKDAFLKRFLLDKLTKINTETTILPRHPIEANDEQEDEVFLTTYAAKYKKTARRRGRNLCEWKERPSVKHSDLEYHHEFKSERKYLEEINGQVEGSSMYSLLCHTQNQLIIPTTHRPGCLEILIRGESFIRLFQEDKSNQWSKRASAKWDAYIRILSQQSGLVVQVSEAIVPVFNTVELEGNYLEAPLNSDVEKLLRDELPKKIDLQPIAKELQDMLQGTWKYGFAGLYEYPLRSPIFTREGELAMQLLPQEVAPVRVAPTSPDARLGVPVLQVNGRPGSRAGNRGPRNGRVPSRPSSRADTRNSTYSASGAGSVGSPLASQLSALSPSFPPLAMPVPSPARLAIPEPMTGGSSTTRNKKQMNYVNGVLESPDSDDGDSP